MFRNAILAVLALAALASSAADAEARGRRHPGRLVAASAPVCANPDLMRPCFPVFADGRPVAAGRGALIRSGRYVGVAEIPAHHGALQGVARPAGLAGGAETCLASQYGVGDVYNGRRTASGEIFDTYARSPFTLAHRTRPFGSFVTVTNLANGRTIRAKVTDRGPFVAGRCVDLGRAGANALGMGGLARVSVQ